MLLIAVTLGAMLTACGSPAKPFLGKWNAYQVSTNGSTIVFENMAQLVKMDLNVTFYEDGTYVVHYYVNGQEGSAYPQAGSYTVEGETLTLGKKRRRRRHFLHAPAYHIQGQY